MAVKAEKTPGTRTISVAHSPDSDDAFMFYGLATNKLETDGLKFEHTLKDIQSLNEAARRGVYDVTLSRFTRMPMLPINMRCCRTVRASVTNTVRSWSLKSRGMPMRSAR